MINVTTRATMLLKEMLREARQTVQPAEESVLTLRLVPDGEEWGVVLDAPREGDHIVEKGNDPVLAVGSEIGAALVNATIETEQTPTGERLVISFQN